MANLELDRDTERELNELACRTGETSQEIMKKAIRILFEKEYLRILKDYTQESQDFFKNNKKQEREKRVCRAFLRCMGIDFKDDNIFASNQEPPDVVFLNEETLIPANFEILELLEDNRRRGDELKEKIKKIESAESIKAIYSTYSVPQSIDYSELVSRIEIALKKKIKKYENPNRVEPVDVGKIDALVYVNLKDRFLDVKSAIPDLFELKSQGWRSVSFVFVPNSVVLFANDSAPYFLRENVGQALRKWPHSDGWFD